MITNEEVREILKCITSQSNLYTDINTCPHKKHKGLCMMMLVAISTYKQWRRDAG